MRYLVPESGIHSDAYLKFFDRHGVARPSFSPHGTEQEVLENMTQAKPGKWHMEGPGKLVTDTELGKLVYFLKPDQICTGTDNNGHPIIAKIKPQQYYKK